MIAEEDRKPRAELLPLALYQERFLDRAVSIAERASHPLAETAAGADDGREVHP